MFEDIMEEIEILKNLEKSKYSIIVLQDLIKTIEYYIKNSDFDLKIPIIDNFAKTALYVNVERICKNVDYNSFENMKEIISKLEIEVKNYRLFNNINITKLDLYSVKVNFNKFTDDFINNATENKEIKLSKVLIKNNDVLWVLDFKNRNLIIRSRKDKKSCFIPINIMLGIK